MAERHKNELHIKIQNGKLAPPVPTAVARSNNNMRPLYKPVIKNPMNDFLRRKEEYARNKAKGKGFFNNPISKPKKDDLSEIDEHLNKIRMKNYNNRKVLNLYDPNALKKKQNEVNTSSSGANSRQKRIAALKVNLLSV